MKPIFLSVDPDLDVAPFQQVIEQLRGFIERGELQPGAALPTVRQLAGDLGVAPNTVARAYTELQDSGWLTSDGRRGTHVTSRTPAMDKRARGRALRDSVERFISTLKHRGYSDNEVASALRDFAR
ncbi:MAG TPA: GntR family transcriptional regulator [Candidatus Eremiobacteraceae bacterium]